MSDGQKNFLCHSVALKITGNWFHSSTFVLVNVIWVFYLVIVQIPHWPKVFALSIMTFYLFFFLTSIQSILCECRFPKTGHRRKCLKTGRMQDTMPPSFYMPDCDFYLYYTLVLYSLIMICIFTLCIFIKVDHSALSVLEEKHKCVFYLKLATLKSDEFTFNVRNINDISPAISMPSLLISASSDSERACVFIQGNTCYMQMSDRSSHSEQTCLKKSPDVMSECNLQQSENHQHSERMGREHLDVICFSSLFEEMGFYFPCGVIETFSFKC